MSLECGPLGPPGRGLTVKEEVAWHDDIILIAKSELLWGVRILSGKNPSLARPAARRHVP